MKIEGPSKSSGTKDVSKTKRKQDSGKTSGASFKGFLDKAGSGDDSVSGAGGTQAASGVNAVWALQEVGSSTDQPSRGRAAIQRADNILDGLEELHMGIIYGQYSSDQLKNLQARVARQKETVDDRRLQEVLDEIDMRAQIEMAKFERD